MRWIAGIAIAACLSGCGDAQRPPNDLAPVAKDILTPMRQVQFPNAYSIYGWDGVRTIERMRHAAARKARRLRDCDEVSYSEWAEQRSAEEGRPNVLVMCTNGLRRYYAEPHLRDEM